MTTYKQSVHVASLHSVRGGAEDPVTRHLGVSVHQHRSLIVCALAVQMDPATKRMKYTDLGSYQPGAGEDVSLILELADAYQDLRIAWEDGHMLG